ncbi:MAG: hypothetical protein PWQ25_375 [Deferribacteres bacterium]|jgi:AraC-like DNA-binding protein|nr:hypothetical protein [Deferribacteres bacterium]
MYKKSDIDLLIKIKEFVQTLARLTKKGEQRVTAVDGLSLFRNKAPTDPIGGLYEPSICVVAQGAKQVILGEDSFVYDAHHYLITSTHLPTIVRVIDASEEKPFLGLMLKLDLREISQLMADSQLPPPREKKSSRGMTTGEMTLPLLDAFRRLVNLLEEEKDIPVLAPIIKKEIMYRLLVGDQGFRLRQMASTGSPAYTIGRIIDWMKKNFNQPLRIDDLADKAGMSRSAFHHHFREVTGLSPLQFQKQLRLHEARRLMLVEQMDAATAAFQVGYESPSQFSREYKRLFGKPPSIDIYKLRLMTSV